jgi:hypothetical protein
MKKYLLLLSGSLVLLISAMAQQQRRKNTGYFWIGSHSVAAGNDEVQ